MKKKNPIQAYKRLLAKDHDWDYAHAKIVECQQMLKKTTGPFNNAVKKIRNGVVNRERKLAALNRKFRQEEREKNNNSIINNV